MAPIEATVVFMLLMANRGANNKQALWSPEEKLLNTPCVSPKSLTCYYFFNPCAARHVYIWFRTGSNLNYKC